MDESSRRKTEFIPHPTEKKSKPEQLKKSSDKYENQTKELLQQFHQNLQNLGIPANSVSYFNYHKNFVQIKYFWYFFFYFEIFKYKLKIFVL